MQKILTGLFMLCYTLTSAQEQTLYLDPENAIGAKAALFFSDAELIPLETSAASRFTNMEGFVATPDYYIFLDGASHAVLIFSRQGKFIYKYKKKKYQISSIQYVASRNALFIISHNKNFTIPDTKAQQMIQRAGEDKDFSKYVNLELLPLSNVVQQNPQKLPVPKFALQNLYYFNNYYLAANGRYNKYLKDTVAYHLSMIDGNIVRKNYFPFLNIAKLPPFYHDIGIHFDPLDNDSALLVQKEFDNTVYTLTPDSIFVKYKFVFPASSTMPADFNTTLFKNNIEYTNYIKQHDKAIAWFNNMIEHKPYFIFSTHTNGYKSTSFIFNTTNNMLYDMGKITTDSSVYFLPNKIFPSIMESDKDHLYAVISAKDLFAEKMGLMNRDSIMPASFKKILEQLRKSDNHIVVKLTTKPIKSAQ